MKRSMPLDSKIKVKIEENLFDGTYKGIDLDGAIKIMRNNKIEKFHSLEFIDR